MNNVKNDLEKEVDKNKEIENELQKKEYAIKEYKDKIKKLSDAKDKEIQKYEEEKKELELLQDKVKCQVENLKLNLLEENNINNNKTENNNETNDNNDFDINNDTLKINEQSNDRNDEDDFDLDYIKKEWVIYDREETLSVNLNENKEQNDVFNDYEIIENFDENEQNVATSKKVEV